MPKVLVTRPLPAAEDTAARLAARGYTPVLAPMLRIAPLRPALPPPERLQAILVPSGNALPALTAGYGQVKLLAVGAATAEAARAQGFAEVMCADGDAVALVQLARARLDPAGPPLLLAHGAGQGDSLADALTAAGFNVQRAAVYAAMAETSLPAAARAAFDEGVAWALFFSAETARAFVRAVAAAPGGAALAEAVAIGAAAAEALSGLPWRRVHVALRPTQDSMLAILP